MATHHRMNLNNLLQKHGLSDKLSWEEVESGVAHASTWTAKVFIDRKEYGRGQGNTLDDAKEVAAYKALQAIEQDNGFQ